jgi:putative adhesin
VNFKLSSSVICTLALAALAVTPTLAREGPRHAHAGGEANHITADKTGTLTTHDGLRLHLVTDIGNVKVKTQDAESVNYRVHLETEAGGSDAQRLLDDFEVIARSTPDGVVLAGRAPGRHWGQRLWVTFEVTIPKDYSVDVATAGGNIDFDGFNGRAVLATDGGNITGGNLDGAARVTTDGGNIALKDVTGDLVATTGGGDISAGTVGGSAVLRTGGGLVKLGSVAGIGRIETGGGNIYVGRSAAGLGMSTGGGQIEVGEAAGIVRAQTGGGGIRIVRSIGPTRLDTGSGAIYLTQAENAVRASTGAGGITAWFSRGAKLSGPCRLEAGEGDIYVYLPKLLAITVDAQIELGGDHRVIVDPGLPLKVIYGDREEGNNPIRAEGSLNGGGETLVLRTVSGNIHLLVNDAENEKKQMELLQQQMEQLRRQLGMELLKLQIQPHLDQQ